MSFSPYILVPVGMGSQFFSVNFIRLFRKLTCIDELINSAYKTIEKIFKILLIFIR